MSDNPASVPDSEYYVTFNGKPLGKKKSRNRGVKGAPNIKRKLAARDGLFCYLCSNDRLTLEELTVDHKIPWSKGGTNRQSNLALACSVCNNRKGDMTVEEFHASERRRLV